MKKLLLVCPDFFGYQKRILEALNESGWDVDVFDDRFDAGFVRKGLLRYARSAGLALLKSQNAALRDLVARGAHDRILIINGEGLDAATFQAIAGTGKSVFYTWDSTRNKSYLPGIFALMDSYTFDPKDAKTHKIAYLPLFWKASRSPENQTSKAFDYSFIGSLHSNRIPVIADLIAAKPTSRKYIYFYSPTFVHLALAFLKDPAQVLALRDYIHLSSLKYDIYIDVCQSSEFTIDIAHPAQIGATMRSLEVLGMQGKVLTNNPELARLFADLQHDIEVFPTASAATVRQSELATPVVGQVEDLEIEKWAARLLA